MTAFFGVACGARTAVVSVSATDGTTIDTAARPIAEVPARVVPVTAPRAMVLPVVDSEPPHDASRSSDFALDDATEPPASMCTIVGTGAPLAGSCGQPTLELFANEGSKVPIGVVTTRRVSIAFALSADRRDAFTTVVGGGVVASGFTPIREQRFRLLDEAPAFGGRIVLRPNAPVTIARVGRDTLSLEATDPVVDLTNALGEATCDSLSFDAFAPPARTSRRGEVGRRRAITRGVRLDLERGPGRPTFFALRTNSESDLDLSLDVLDRANGSARVVFSTESANFDAWVPASEIDEESRTSFGGSVGSLGCHSGQAKPKAAFDLDRAVEVLVAKTPTSHGPPGIHLERGAEVEVVTKQSGWSAIVPTGVALRPPEDLFYWVPSDALTPVVLRRWSE